MNALPLRVALTAALALCSGLAFAAPPPVLDGDPIGFLRYIETSKSPQARTARREAAAGPTALALARTEARKEGIAVFPAQLNRPLPPEDQNAAPLYLKLSQRVHDRSLEAPPLSAARDPVQKNLDDSREIVALLRQATDRPQCVFPPDPPDDTDDIRFHRSSPVWFQQRIALRRWGHELEGEAVLQAKQGRYAEAVATDSRVYRVAEHTASDPTLFSLLVAEDIDAAATGGMQDILTLAGPNAAVDAQVGRAVTDKAPRLSLRHALSGEIASVDASFSRFRRDGPGTLVGLFSMQGSAPRLVEKGFTPEERHFYSDLLDAAEAEVIQQMRPVIRAPDLPDGAAEAAVEALARRVPPPPTDDLVHEVARHMSPLPYVLANVRPARVAASHSITRAAAAVLAARAKTGVYPAALPGRFPDPYAPARQLGYRREGAGGFVVYSVGPGGKYDGAEPVDPRDFYEAGFRFRYPSAPASATDGK